MLGCYSLTSSYQNCSYSIWETVALSIRRVNNTGHYERTNSPVLWLWQSETQFVFDLEKDEMELWSGKFITPFLFEISVLLADCSFFKEKENILNWWIFWSGERRILTMDFNKSCIFYDDDSSCKVWYIKYVVSIILRTIFINLYK